MCDVAKLKVHKRCKTPDEISILFIQTPKEQVGICNTCWGKIADKDWEIGDGPKPTMEDILSDKSRGLEGAVLTEYKYRGKEIEPKSDEENEA